MPGLKTAATVVAAARLSAATLARTTTHLQCRLSRTAVQVANEIWVVDKGTVQKWDGDIVSYKQHLRQQHAALAKRDDMK